MRGQGGQLIKRALVQRIGVDQIGSGKALFSVPAGIAPGRIARRNRRRHRFDAVGQARQRREIARQQGVEPLAHLGGFFEQFLRRLGIELRIRAQEGDEVLETAVKFDFSNNLVHFGADARDLRLAELMNFFRRVTRACGVKANRDFISGLSALQCRQPWRCACGWRVLFFHEPQEFGVGFHGTLNRRLALVSKRQDVQLTELGRVQRLKRHVQRAVGRVFDHLGTDLRD